MAAIESMTAPLLIRWRNGSKKLAAACFPHPSGLLYLDLFWHLSTPDEAAHLIHGQLTGEGPWKIGDAVIRVLGCHGTDPDMQADFKAWEQYLLQNSGDYPSREQIADIARRLGAFVH